VYVGVDVFKRCVLSTDLRDEVMSHWLTDCGKLFHSRRGHFDKNLISE